MVVVGVGIALGVALFLYSLLVLPRLQPLPESAELRDPLRAGIAPAEFRIPVLPRPWLRQISGAWATAVHPLGGAVRLGFLDEDADRALRSLQAHADRLTHLAPAWLNLSGMPPRLKVTGDTPPVRQVAAAHRLALVPVLSNQAGDRADPEAVEHLLRAEPAQQDAFAAELRSRLLEVGAQGVLVTWDQIDPSYRVELTRFVARLKEGLRPAGLELWLNVPVGDDSAIFDLDGLAAHVDRFVAALYYETGEEDEPGPLASQTWFQEWLEALTQHGDQAQWVIGIGTFGYDWPAKGQPELVSFYDAMARAASAKVTGIADPPPYDGPRFAYQEGGGVHTVWFLDATTFHNQQRQVLGRQVGGIAIDRLGTEDPQIWDLLDCGAACSPASFESVPASDVIATVGQGDFLHVSQDLATGRRAIEPGETGSWAVSYQTLPRTPTVTRRGDWLKGPERVAITFDDGPDPAWTPQILDILKTRGLQATFFVMGQKATAYPELIRRIVGEGHELGNHTYNHPDLARASAWRLRLELNATQRAIESITGRSTLLFRPPYDADRTPHANVELDALRIAEELGYVPAMASIDPLDWMLPSPEEILARVRSQRSHGQVILLHDGGGDRSRTVAALGPLLDYLEGRGDEVVPLHQLLGIPRDGVNPAIPVADPIPERLVAGTGLSAFHRVKDGFWAFLAVSTALLLARALFVVSLALRRTRQEKAEAANGAPSFTPPVSAVLAAYNEERVIAQTVQALLASRYPGPLEMIVVDDGSSDRTAAIVAGIALREPRVRLVRQDNGGKAVALRTGLAAASHEFVVTLDADTQFLPDTLLQLVQPLRDPRVGAVSGHLRVGNLDSWVARFQALEYMAGFNLDRRAYGVLKAITVVPGAASAYRAEAIAAAGGIQADTLAEDTDLTLAMHRAGYRIWHKPRAVAVTEAPRTVRALLRQRKRWSFGTLQCLWKHRDLLFDIRHRWLGLFALPSMWFFHIFLVALVPLIDLALVIALLQGADAALLGYILAFLGVDLALALVACRLEGEPLAAAWRVVPMRLLYRPLLSLAVLDALQRALRGTWMSWGVQERWGLASGERGERIA